MPAPTRILLVEDEFAVALELETRLERLGYEVVGHEMTAPDAVARTADLRPDLVLMDIHLDGPIDGIEAARRIRDRLAIPIIFVTAYGNDETVARAAETTPAGYIVKPIAERDLYAAVEVALRTHALEQRLRQSREDLQTILDGLREGTLLITADGTVSFVSRPAARLLGIDAASASGCQWGDVVPFPPDVLDALHDRIQQPAPAGSAGDALPVSFARHDGTTVEVNVEVRPDPRSSDRRIMVLHDVTREAHLRRLLDEQDRFHDLVGSSPAMTSLFDQIRSLAPVDVTVQIRGETGTGKELVARALHAESHRADGPFVPVNCAALQANLAGSLLFGHRRGAFTGAVDDRSGYFETADGGTLFLDEVGDLPLDVQQQLLRVLETRRVARLGETTERPVDVRIVSATHRPLEENVRGGTFREDLLYRLRVARLDVPPLRERLSDLPVLARTLQQRAEVRMNLPAKSLTDDALQALLTYDWPGNVRELRNAITSALIRASGPTIRASDLPPEVGGSPDGSAFSPASAPEAERIRAALHETDGNRSAAADLLGISRSTLYRRLREYDVQE
jgi:PAS domain S-box-containing protein